MWPFRHKIMKRNAVRPGPPCPYCGNTNTRLTTYHGTDKPDYVRVWRGKRSLTYRCSGCDLEFYGEEPQGRIIDELITDDRIIDDEEELHAAEDEIMREIEEDGDRRCW